VHHPQELSAVPNQLSNKAMLHRYRLHVRRARACAAPAGMPRCLGRLRGLRKLAFTAREDVSLLHLPGSLTELVLHADCKGCHGQARGDPRPWRARPPTCQARVGDMDAPCLIDPPLTREFVLSPKPVSAWGWMSGRCGLS
jgi:hypothetical protein